ncbi:MAG: hypothetical protein U5M23_08670 [Marinagarivorans sp.]|nr:hypothetical protein [Marinagarivorans sp.]
MISYAGCARADDRRQQQGILATRSRTIRKTPTAALISSASFQGAADHQDGDWSCCAEKIATNSDMFCRRPKVDVEILDFTLVGPVLAVRPYCHTDNYWRVYFGNNKMMREALAEAGFSGDAAQEI